MGSVGKGNKNSSTVAAVSTAPEILDLNDYAREFYGIGVDDLTDEDYDRIDAEYRNWKAEQGNRKSESQITAALRTIDRTSFTNEGGGQWTLDIEGVGGGQLLDERDSSRAGFGTGPAYGITVWDKDYKSSEQTIFYGSLNEAKAELKRRLKELQDSTSTRSLAYRTVE